MSEISFFTPVVSQDNSASYFQTLLEKVDDCLYLGNKKVQVIQLPNSDSIEQNDGKTLYVRSIEAKPSMFVTSLKVASYCTIILPLIMIINHTVFRLRHNFILIPSLDFDTPVNLSLDQVCTLRINIITNRSMWPQYQNSSFDLNEHEDGTFEIIRRRIV